MKTHAWKIGIATALALATFTLAAPASAQLRGAAPHGAPAWHGTWHGDGRGWWGWGLGFGLGWEEAYLLGWPYYYPYYGYPYYYYYYNEPPVVAPPPEPAPPPTWYYCDSAKGYYPSVPQCPEGWRAVPAVPPPSPPR